MSSIISRFTRIPIRTSSRCFCSASLHKTPSAAYEELIGLGKANLDERQVQCLAEFDRLYEDILERVEKLKNPEPEPKKSFFSSWFGKEEIKSKRNNVKGLFLYGDGGCGKTFLMDLMYEIIPIEKKRRTHFHSFMLEVHKKLHQQRQELGDTDVSLLGKQMVEENGELFCFDELNPTEVGDAVTIKLLFEAMVENGAILVTTGKLPPDEVYKNGRSRELFLPCIELLKDTCNIHHMNSNVNYRLIGSAVDERYHTPHTEHTDAILDKKFEELTNGKPYGPIDVKINTRKLHVNKACDNVADFTFFELADQPNGAAEYYAIAQNFDTIIIRDVPILHSEDAHWGKRFLTLLDILYDHKAKTFISAAAEPLDIVTPALLKMSNDSELRLEDIISRLSDMRTEVYQDTKYRTPKSI